MNENPTAHEWRVPRTPDDVVRLFRLGCRVEHLSPELPWTGLVVLDGQDEDGCWWYVNQDDYVLVCVRWDETGDGETAFDGWTLADAITPYVPIQSPDDPMAGGAGELIDSNSARPDEGNDR